MANNNNELILYWFILRSMYHRAGLLSRSIHFFEGARSKFEQAYKSAPGLAEGLLLYALVRIGRKCNKIEDDF